MPATPEAEARTGAFARVLGPFFAIVAGIVTLRMPDVAVLFTAFFANAALVWITGALLLFGGILIIAQHQYWSSPAAVLISLLGWLLALRGLALLLAPQWFERIGESAAHALPMVRIGFAILCLVGLWLSYVGWTAKPGIRQR